MRLLRTGAFLRAARSAYLTSKPAARSHQRWLSQSCQRADSADKAKSQPEQLEPQVGKESFGGVRRVEQWQTDGIHAPFARPKLQQEEQERKSEPPTPEEQHQLEARFQQHLLKQPHNQITRYPRTALTGANILGQPFIFDTTSNLTSSILSHTGRNLYNTPNHPLHITRRLIESVFQFPTYKNHVASNPVVSVYDNFDVLGFPSDHPGRSRTDTYYVDSTHVLRTHSSAHQHKAFEYRNKHPENLGYTICADVYRRDSIDRSHFPVFHQMEGARTWQLLPSDDKHETRLQQQKRRADQIRKDINAIPKHNLEIIDEAGPMHPQNNPVQIVHDPEDSALVAEHLKRSLEQLVQKVFTAAAEANIGSVPQEKLKVRWIEAYFPFTSPSFELEVFWQGEWLELLGSGVVQQSILNKAGLHDHIAWAWGLGIERLAMILFNIPDIRLFWSQDERFLNQFKDGQITRFQPFSKYPPCPKDISFWINPSPAHASPLNTSSDPTTNPGPGIAAAAGGDSTRSDPSHVQPAAFHENDLMEIIRDVAGDLVEDVKLFDEFVDKRTGRKSLAYRIVYRSNERTLTNEEVGVLHFKVCEGLGELPITIR